jgi:hypothetical protein
MNKYCFTEQEIYRVEEKNGKYYMVEIVLRSNRYQYKYFIKDGKKYYKRKCKSVKGYKYNLTSTDFSTIVELEDNDSALLYLRLQK